MSPARLGIFVFLVLAGLFLILLPGLAVQAIQVEPTATPGGMISIEDRLARPTLPTDPVQADLGGQVYYYVCMACHGDQGQGLTPEWIEEWGLEKNTCWESKCHASNHPPEGFELPRTIPPVVGSLVMSRFSTALELHDYIRALMPWQAPGTLSEEEYWQLTAFLLRLNGVDPGPGDLDEIRAAAIRWQPEPLVVTTPSPVMTETSLVQVGRTLLPASLLILGVLVGFVLVVAALRKRRFR